MRSSRRSLARTGYRSTAVSAGSARTMDNNGSASRTNRSRVLRNRASGTATCARRVPQVTLPEAKASSTTGSKNCAASSRPSLKALRFSAMLRSAMRSRRAGSIPACHRSACRHSHGVGTSQPVARRILARSQSRRSGLGYWPTIDNGSRRTISAKQTSAELVLVVVLHDPHRPGPEHVDRAVEQGPLCQSDTR